MKEEMSTKMIYLDFLSYFLINTINKTSNKRSYKNTQEECQNTGMVVVRNSKVGVTLASLEIQSQNNVW